MPILDDQHKPKPGDYDIFRQFIRIHADGSGSVIYTMRGSIQATVGIADLNKVEDRTGGDPFHQPGVSAPGPVDAPIEDHSTGGPTRPAGEEPPPDMTGGGKPIRGGGQPGGTTSNPKGDDDGDGVKNRNDRFPDDPSRS